MRTVTLSVVMVVNDDTRPEKWLADTITENCLEPGEELVQVEVVSDEPVAP